MRAYRAASEEALRTHKLLKDWAGEGLLTAAQHQRMKLETECELRRTNIFLRGVLFLFTLIIVGAAAALFFEVFFARANLTARGVWLLIFAAVTYAAAESAVARGRLYRYGIEEALLVGSMVFLGLGIEAVWFNGPPYPAPRIGTAFVIPAACSIFALWIWHRFGLTYAFVAAMVLTVWLPDYWVAAPFERRIAIAAVYSAGLTAVAAVRPRYRLTYLDISYSAVEAFLWLGIYAAINLQLLLLTGAGGWWWNGMRTKPEFPAAFFWTTWVLTWCLPPLMLARGLRRNDRLVAAAGAIAAILTLVTNKPYLGWPRHTWDPMLLGILLVGAALGLRWWLAKGTDGIRNGFTARRLSGRDKTRMNAGSAALAMVAPQSMMPAPPAAEGGVHFGGGDSGGGGASSDF